MFSRPFATTAVSPFPSAPSDNPPYSPYTEVENGVTLKLHSVSAMPAYCQRSFEEIRMEDYGRGRKGKQVGPMATFTASTTLAGTGSFMGQQQQPVSPFTSSLNAPQSPFGKAEPASPIPAFGQPKTTSFGSVPGFGGVTQGSFGQPSQAPTTGFGTSTFGQSSTTRGFGQPPHTQPATSPFGQPQQPSSSLFSAPAPTTGFATLSTHPAPTPTSSLFGQPAQPPPQPAPTLFPQLSQQPAPPTVTSSLSTLPSLGTSTFLTRPLTATAPPTTLPLVQAPTSLISPPTHPALLTKPVSVPPSESIKPSPSTAPMPRTPLRLVERALPLGQLQAQPYAASYTQLLPRRTLSAATSSVRRLVIEAHGTAGAPTASHLAPTPRTPSTREGKPDSDQPAFGDFYTIPSESVLRRWSPSQLQSVPNFVAGQRSLGQIRFLKPVDLTAIDLDELFPGTSSSSTPASTSIPTSTSLPLKRKQLRQTRPFDHHPVKASTCPLRCASIAAGQSTDPPGRPSRTPPIPAS